MYLITSVIGALFTIIPTTIHGALLDLAGPFTPTAYSDDIGAVPMKNCMNYKFDLVINSFCTDWCNVIHVGNDDSLGNQLYQRMPAIFMHPNWRNKFTIVAGTTSIAENQVFVGPAAGLSTDTVYSFDITYDQPGFSVIVNDEVIYENAAWGNHCLSGDTCHGVLVEDEVPIQIGQHGWYLDLDATISNLLITDCADLCADVDCDDGDLCTDEYCDENTGECVYSDVDCTDAFACTIDSCDPETGCVNEEMDCSNGNICDGEEACVEGECITPNDFDCPTHFLCDEDLQQCVADCSSFAIDGYLTDCSVEFDEQATQLEEVGAALTSLTTFSSVLEERINENFANIESGDALFVSLKDEVVDITSDVETNTADIATILAALAAIHLDTDLGTDTSAASSGLFNVDLAEFTTKYNGELMVFLVAMNMMLLVALVILSICYCKSDTSVQMYATTDDESMQLKQ